MRRFLMADVVLINPKFEMSFWGLNEALPFLLKKANLPTTALPLLAALTPDTHQVTIIDENVEPIDFDRCARAYVVGGGPWITVNETYFGELVDVAFIGEAEETWPRFLTDWQDGTVSARYE